MESCSSQAKPLPVKESMKRKQGEQIGRDVLDVDVEDYAEVNEHHDEYDGIVDSQQSEEECGFSDEQEIYQDPEEQQHFTEIIYSFLCYERFSDSLVRHALREYDHIPENHQKLLRNYKSRISSIKECAKINMDVLTRIARPEFLLPDGSFDFDQEIQKGPPLGRNMEKVQGTLKQFVREWSAEGAVERKMCFDPLLKDLSQAFPEQSERKDKKVLIPGTGLGRLAWEAARLGFQSEGNEFSYFMLLGSNFILNQYDGSQMTIHPFIFQWSNMQSSVDQLRAIKIPDVDPFDLPEGARFSMSAGDFTEIYQDHQEEYDAVCTCFFLDTAHNIVEYVEIISRILKPGGVWANFGG
eukprot:TRINITY_DN5430_c0_g1_i3.p1 TRINITY_DN5430_c0_g1~~TRINITY_DN5430_c0_g1_i3.p1  ORF type:complete len:354 (+),score=78.41 TRINITY_DN5430_c0_g1_i3:59-1120(+)